MFTHRPTQRTHAFIRPLHANNPQACHLTQKELSLQQAPHWPTPRLSGHDPRLERLQHRALIAQLHALQERFQIIYLGLPSAEQLALRNRLEEAELAIWHFCNRQQDAQQALEQRDACLTHQQHQLEHQLMQLMSRLEQLTGSNHSSTTQTKAQQDLKPTAGSRETLKRDEDPDWSVDCLTLCGMIEAALLSLSRMSSLPIGTTHVVLPPLTASPGAIKLEERRASSRAIAVKKKREQQRQRLKQSQKIQQEQSGVARGAQPLNQKEDTFLEGEQAKHLHTPNNDNAVDDEQES
jgi:hypothetical protein